MYNYEKEDFTREKYEKENEVLNETKEKVNEIFRAGFIVGGYKIASHIRQFVACCEIHKDTSDIILLRVLELIQNLNVEDFI